MGVLAPAMQKPKNPKCTIAKDPTGGAYTAPVSYLVPPPPREP